MDYKARLEELESYAHQLDHHKDVPSEVIKAEIGVAKKGLALIKDLQEKLDFMHESKWNQNGYKYNRFLLHWRSVENM